MAVLATSVCFVTIFVVAFATHFSQRYDGFSSSYEWNPSVPPSDRVRPARNNDAQNWNFKDSVPQASRRSLKVKPEPSTVTATISWPRVHRSKPVFPPPQPEPSEPDDDDLEDPIADPDTDPPVLAAPNEETGEPVVKTTLLTPLSHGYVVAFVKKPLLPKLNGNSPNGRLVNLTPNLPFQFKKGDDPAFLMYIPPGSSKGQSNADRTLSGDRRLRSRRPKPAFNVQRDIRTDDVHEFDYEEAFRDAEAAAERARRRPGQRQRNFRSREPPVLRGNLADLLRPEVVATYVQDEPLSLEPAPYQTPPSVLMVVPHQQDAFVHPRVFTADDKFLFQVPRKNAARGLLKMPPFSFL